MTLLISQQVSEKCADVLCADVLCADVLCADVLYADVLCADVLCADVLCADVLCADVLCADVLCADVLCADVLCADVLCADVLCADVLCAEYKKQQQSIQVYGKAIQLATTSSQYLQGKHIHIMTLIDQVFIHVPIHLLNYDTGTHTPEAGSTYMCM